MASENPTPNAALELDVAETGVAGAAAKEEEQVPVQDDRTWFQRMVIGDYNYRLLCRPRLNPWKKEQEGGGKLAFFGPDDPLPLLPCIFLGFQHSIAVLGGTVIPGILLGNQDPSGQAGRYLVS